MFRRRRSFRSFRRGRSSFRRRGRAGRRSTLRGIRIGHRM